MSFLQGITFYEVSMALVLVGCAERVLLAYAPVEMVGPNGWLFKGDIQE